MPFLGALIDPNIQIFDPVQTTFGRTCISHLNIFSGKEDKTLPLAVLSDSLPNHQRLEQKPATTLTQTPQPPYHFTTSPNHPRPCQLPQSKSSDPPALQQHAPATLRPSPPQATPPSHQPSSPLLLSASPSSLTNSTAPRPRRLIRMMV